MMEYIGVSLKYYKGEIMKEYNKPILEDETIEIEDIINESLANGGTRGANIDGDPDGEPFSNGGIV